MGSGSALPLILLAVPGLALLVSARFLFGEAPESRTSPARLAISISGWLMVWTGIVGGLLAICGLTIAGVLLAAILSVVLCLVVAMGWVRLRRSEHRALLGALAAGMERGIPAPESARAMADEVQGSTGMRAVLLARELERGMPLDLAVARARLWLGTGLKVAIRAGCALGLPAAAIKRELAASKTLEDAVRPLVPRILYVISLTMFVLIIVSAVMLWIVPMFDRLFQDFNLELPPLTASLVKVSRWLSDELSIPLVLLNLLLIHIFCFSAAIYVGILPRNLPLLDRLFLRYDGSIVLRSLAWAVQCGAPLPLALRQVAQVYPISGVRGRLLATVEQVEQGGNWCEALSRARLISAADVAVLQSAQRAGNLAWAMDEVADSLLRREFYRWQWWYNVVSPITIALFGAAIGYFSVAMFAPMAALIRGLAS
jgi:type II secretory pathway component PulF